MRISCGRWIWDQGEGWRAQAGYQHPKTSEDMTQAEETALLKAVEDYDDVMQ